MPLLVGVGDGSSVGVSSAVGVRVNAGVAERVPVGVAVRVPETVALGVMVMVPVGVTVKVPVTVAVGVPVSRVAAGRGALWPAAGTATLTSTLATMIANDAAARTARGGRAKIGCLLGSIP